MMRKHSELIAWYRRVWRVVWKPLQIRLFMVIFGLLFMVGFGLVIAIGPWIHDSIMPFSTSDLILKMIVVLILVLTGIWVGTKVWSFCRRKIKGNKLG